MGEVVAGVAALCREASLPLSLGPISIRSRRVGLELANGLTKCAQLGRSSRGTFGSSSALHQ
jgi:hypothetical protein